MIAFAASASGSASRPRTRCSGRPSALRAATASLWAAITTFRARGVNRLKSWLAPASPPSLGTNRFCAACRVTPMLLPMSVQEAPERRAWSTEWPGGDHRVLELFEGLGVDLLDGRDEVVEAYG